MKRDIEIAREIQRWLVPRRAPDVPGIDVAFAMHPAKTIGGDYYDAFLSSGDGPLLIAVADIAGKSVPAAMMMATFQASLRALASASGTLSELVGGLNRQVCANSQAGDSPPHFSPNSIPLPAISVISAPGTTRPFSNGKMAASSG
jgi:sigma-B regulation protein RsbU (phosphoserine phosphatase)